MSDQINNVTIYEQPLSERIRAFLRLEHLFARANHQLTMSDPWSNRTTLEVLIDMMAVVSRIDLKKELLKELERHSKTLESLARNPNVDLERLSRILAQIKRMRTTLLSSNNALGHQLRGNELLNLVRQRNSIPAGTCDFDVPAYHYWLQSPAEVCQRDLRMWLSAFELLDEAISLTLRLVRESAITTRETAKGGFYQRSLETSTPCQMIRVSLPKHAGYYPEISAGRHRFTVRFMRPDNPAERPTQTEKDVEFNLLRCVI